MNIEETIQDIWKEIPEAKAVAFNTEFYEGYVLVEDKGVFERYLIKNGLPVDHDKYLHDVTSKGDWYWVPVF